LQPALWSLMPLGVVDGAYQRSFGLAFGATTERSEVMFTVEALSRLVHFLNVERLFDMPFNVRQEGVGNWGIQHVVVIETSFGREPGVKIGLHGLNMLNLNIGSAEPVK